MFESVNGPTDGRQLEPHPVICPGAFSSGELKYEQLVSLIKIKNNFCSICLRGDTCVVDINEVIKGK